MSFRITLILLVIDIEVFCTIMLIKQWHFHHHLEGKEDNAFHIVMR